jgi:transcriptional regulator with XRE-family HTH domain
LHTKRYNLTDFAARLREERTRLDINQAKMATFLGVTRNVVVSYESGKTSPSVGALFNASEYGLDPAYVITGIRGGAILPPDEQLLLDKYLSLSPTMREIAHVMISSIGDKPDEEKRAEAKFWLATPPGSSSGTLHSPRIDYKAEPANPTE